MKPPLIALLVVAVVLGGCTSGSDPSTPTLPGTESPAQQPKVEDRDCASTSTAQRGGVKIRLRVAPCRVPVGVAPGATLINVGKRQAGYGPGFVLERKTPGGWRRVNRNQAFELPLFYLEPGDRSDPESLAVYLRSPKPVELKPGTYRVTKSFILDPGTSRPPTIPIRTTFEIVAALG